MFASCLTYHPSLCTPLRHSFVFSTNLFFGCNVISLSETHIFSFSSCLFDNYSVSNLGYVTCNHARSIIDYECSISNHADSIMNHAGSIMNHEGSIMNHADSIMNHEGSIMNHEGSIMNHEGSITNHEGSITNHEGSIMNFSDFFFHNYPSINY